MYTTTDLAKELREQQLTIAQQQNDLPSDAVAEMIGAIIQHYPDLAAEHAELLERLREKFDYSLPLVPQSPYNRSAICTTIDQLEAKHPEFFRANRAALLQARAMANEAKEDTSSRLLRLKMITSWNEDNFDENAQKEFTEISPRVALGVSSESFVGCLDPAPGIQLGAGRDEPAKAAQWELNIAFQTVQQMLSDAGFLEQFTFDRVTVELHLPNRKDRQVGWLFQCPKECPNIAALATFGQIGREVRLTTSRVILPQQISPIDEDFFGRLRPGFESIRYADSDPMLETLFALMQTQVAACLHESFWIRFGKRQL